MKKRTLLIFLVLFITAIEANSQKTLVWKFKTNGRIYSSPVVENDLIYFGSADSFFYAINKTSGELKWRFKTGSAIYSSPAINKEIVYFSSDDGNLYALNKSTGIQVFNFKSEGEHQYDLWDYYRSSATIMDQIIYWACGDSMIYALNAGNGNKVWSFKTNGIVHATPVFHNNIIYVGGFDGFFYALNAKSGELVWKINTIGDANFPKGEVQKAALVSDGIVYFGTRDFNIYALDAQTGTGKWNMKEQNGWIIATPVEYKGNIYYGLSDGHKFYCQDKKSGAIKWEKPVNMRVYGSGVIFNDLVFFGCFNGRMYGVDYQTGETKWTFETDGCKENYYSVYERDDNFRKDFILYGKDYLKSEEKIHQLGAILSTPVIDSGIIYFGSSDGNFYAVKIN